MASKKQKRNLGNWLTAFDDWAAPRSEAPMSMIHWTGLFTLAALMKRKIYWPRKLLGSYETYPNLYILFVAQPGVARKSTTAGYAEDLLVSASGILLNDQVTFASTAMSESQLINALSESPDGTLTIISSEFSSFIKTSPEGMYEILTDIYDAKRKFEYSTRQHGVELTEKPNLCLLAATTPAWLGSQPPAYFIGGGFASRTIFIYENQKRRRAMYYDDVDQEKMKKLEADLLNDLSIIAKVDGEFTHDSKTTKDIVEDWYQDHDRNPPDDARLLGYHQRKPAHLHKLMMLLNLADAGAEPKKVEEKHFNQALKLLDSVEDNMSRALTSVSSNPHGTLLEQIEDYIHHHGKVTKKQLARRFWRDINSDDLLDQITKFTSFLEVKGAVEAEADGTNTIYHSRGKTDGNTE